MRQVIRHILQLLLLALLITGCQGGKDTVSVLLTEADALIYESPDSALTILKSIGQADLQTPEHRARYALHYSQALDKNYIDVTSDSLINIAVEFDCICKLNSPMDKNEKGGCKHFTATPTFFT